MKTLIVVVLSLLVGSVFAIEIGDEKLDSLPTKEGCVILVPNDIELSACTLTPRLSFSTFTSWVCRDVPINVVCKSDIILGPIDENKYDWVDDL